MGGVCDGFAGGEGLVPSGVWAWVGDERAAAIVMTIIILVINAIMARRACRIGFMCDRQHLVQPTSYRLRGRFEVVAAGRVQRSQPCSRAYRARKGLCGHA